MTEISEADLQALQGPDIETQLQHTPLRICVKGNGGAWVDVRQMATELLTLRREIARQIETETVEL